ncbi:sugar ABC transporter permease [Streptomyces sp. NBC_00322]|uniref:carbohydrate ABC transporter permease n=1 Tax=Streptomyces sp. NBC_00322 TaxID=2975712 RepID=UPI002E2D267E|nr:sugar ABC transporter permease [Streptomyces sp. NBC_00322]
MPVLTRPAAPAPHTTKPPVKAPTRSSWWRHHRFSIAVLTPSLILIGIFVYGFIGYTVRVSVSKWQGLQPDLSPRDPLYQTYDDMFHTPRFQADLRNVTVFTLLFLTLAVVVGLVLALLVHNALAGRTFFRSIFLFPYALSFIVTGVVWRWIFTPSTGANLILKGLGVDHGPKWITDPGVAGDVSQALEPVLPGGHFIQVELGIPLALIPVVIAASWQLAGFVMANFLAALSALPEELREAASLDGAGTLRYHWHIVLPWLRPVMVVVLILLGHISLKSFDLVYAMVGQGPGFATDVPGIFVFEQTFRALRYNTGAAASVVMFLLSAAVIVPYLYRSVIREKNR